MARPLSDVADIDSIRFDDLSFDGEHGRVGVTLFMPSARQLGLLGDPDVIVPYSAGWGEGRGAAVTACEAMTRQANVMSIVVDYPKKNLPVAEMVPYRTEVLCEVITWLKEETHYDTYDLMLCGYSRGTAPARLAAVKMAEHVRSVVLVAPTWFGAQLRASELAQKGLAESAGTARRGSWLDRLGVVGSSVRLAQELITHPLELRKEVSAIATDGLADLGALLDAGLRVGVVAGLEDDICPAAGIRSALDGLPDPMVVDYREVATDHFGYFVQPEALTEICEQIMRLGEAQG